MARQRESVSRRDGARVGRIGVERDRGAHELVAKLRSLQSQLRRSNAQLTKPGKVDRDVDGGAVTVGTACCTLPLCSGLALPGLKTTWAPATDVSARAIQAGRHVRGRLLDGLALDSGVVCAMMGAGSNDARDEQRNAEARMTSMDLRCYGRGCAT